MATKLYHCHVRVPTAIAQRLRDEANFLHVKSRVKTEDGTELKSMADLVRWVANLYIEACEVDEGPTYDWEETDSVSIALDSATKGRWDYAVKRYFADNYHQLVGNALCWYFDRIDAQASTDAALLRNMQSMNSSTILGYLRGGNYAALQPAKPSL